MRPIIPNSFKTSAPTSRYLLIGISTFAVVGGASYAWYQHRQRQQQFQNRQHTTQQSPKKDTSSTTAKMAVTTPFQVCAVVDMLPKVINQPKIASLYQTYVAISPLKRGSFPDWRYILPVLPSDLGNFSLLHHPTLSIFRPTAWSNTNIVFRSPTDQPAVPFCNLYTHTNKENLLTKTDALCGPHDL